MRTSSKDDSQEDKRQPTNHQPARVRFSETAEVFVRQDGASRSVPISDACKPAVPGEMTARWQEDLTLLTGVLGICTAVVMRISRGKLRAFVCSVNPGNPVTEQTAYDLGGGVLCESVIGLDQTLWVQDLAHTDPWREDGSVRLGLRDYYGVPLHWQDGSFFGTLCTFDRGEALRAPAGRRLISRLAAALERDLAELETQEQCRTARERAADYAEAEEALFRYAPGGIFSYSAEEDEQFSFISVNMLSFLGYTREEFVQKFRNRFSLMVWQEDRRRVLNEIDEQIRHSSFDTCEYRIEKRDGTLAWVHDEGHIVTDEQGKRWFYVVIVDISTSMAAKQTLIRRNRELESTIRDLQTTVDKIPGGIRVFKKSGGEIVCVNANQYYADMLGVRKADLIGETMARSEARLHPDDVARHRAETEANLEQGLRAEGTYRFFSARTNSYRWYHLDAGTELRQDGSALAYLHYTDVDDLKVAEENLQSSRKRYELAVKGAHLAMWEYDIASRRLTVPGGENSSYTRERYGLKSSVVENVPESMLPMGLTDADRERFLQLYRDVWAGQERATADVWFRRSPGDEPRCDRVTYYVIKDADGHPVRAYGVGSDITARRQEQLRFHQAIQSILAANPEALCTFQINLTKNLCYEGHGASAYILHSLQSDTADGLFQNGLRIIPFAEDRTRFAAAFDRKRLLAGFAAGQAGLHVDYRRRNEQGHPFWGRTYISLLKNPENGDVEGVIYSLDISKERQQSEIFHIVTNQEYDYVALLHVPTSQIEFLNLNSRLSAQYRRTLGRRGKLYDFDAMRRLAADTWVDASERERYLSSSAAEEVRRELDHRGHFEFSVRGHYIDRPESVMCRKIQHYYLGGDKDTILIIQTDVTETYLHQQKELEQAQTEKQRVQDILDYISSGVCVLVMPDAEHLNIQYSNRQMPRMLGFPEGVQEPAQLGAGDAPGVAAYFASAFSGVHPDDLPRVREAYRRGYDLPHFSVPSFRLLTGTGEYIWVSVDVALRETRPEGRVFYGTYRDVSREMALQRELDEQQKKRLERTLVEAISALPSSSVLCRVEDGAIRPEQYSDEFCRLCGCSSSQKPAWRTIYDGFFPGDVPRLRRLVTRRLDDGRPFQTVCRIVTDGRACKWVSVCFNTFRFGSARYLYAVYTDVDELKKQEQRLEEQYNSAQAFLDSVSGTYLATRRANLTQNRVEDVKGTDPLPQVSAETDYDDAIRTLIAAMPKEQDRTACARCFDRQTLLAAYENGTRTLSLEYRYRTPAGGVKWARSALTLTRRPGSGDVILFSAVSDIDQERLMESVMAHIVAKQYDCVCCVDIRQAKVAMFLSNTADRRDGQVRSGDDFAAVAADYCTRYVVPGDREAYTAFMDLSRVIRALEEDDRCVTFFAAVENGERRVKQAEFFYIDRESGQVAMVRTDYTEAQRRQLEQEARLRSALEAAQRANAAKSEFLSRMSHDMRTPLNGIIGMTYLAREMELPPRARENLEKIDTSSKFLLSLINDVLDMAKAESKKIELHPEPYPPAEFYAYLDAVIRPLCREKGQTFTLEAEPPADRVPLFDKLRINQVVFNLLSNAVKYTPRGGSVAYRARFTPAGPDGRLAVVIEVSDSGIGMSETFQKILFNPFAQEERADAAQSRGTGLGLTIAKRMVDLMGGTIRVKSQVDVGTTFTLELTVDSVSAGELPPSSDAAGAGFAALAGRRILLCEDHPLNREIAQTLLQEKQAMVESAENGRRGVEKFAASPEGYYDVILMDIRMPELDGYGAARAIRALPRADARTVPIIAMTADAFADDVQRCLAAGMNGHVAKPVEPSQLYGALNAVLSAGTALSPGKAAPPIKDGE